MATTRRTAVVPARILSCGFMIALIVNSCGGSSPPTTPTPPTQPTQQPNNSSIAGTWQGAIRSSVSGATANISLTLTQSGTSVTGNFACPFGCIHSTGTVSGTVSGTALTGRVVFPDGHSCNTFNGTVSGQTMSGNYACTDPLGNDSGSWTATHGGIANPSCISGLPSPQLAFSRSEADGQAFTKYWLSVTNRASFPDALFAVAPDLPACGLTQNASRTWLDIFAAGSMVYGYCGFTSSQDMAQFWFVVTRGAPANPVYITLTDRRCNFVYTSNSVTVSAPR